MSFNGEQITEYTRLTPDDGLLLDGEFGRLYDNDNALKDQADAADDEINGVKEELGINPKGTYVDLVARLAALDNYLRVGKIEWFDQYFATDENAPWLILTDADKTLAAANWPLLVPYYRAKKLKYLPGTGSEKSVFDVTHYARASNVVTITLANTAPELALIAALAEENLVHGSFSGWISLYLPAALGSSDVPVGDYLITALDAGARTISFSHTGSNVGTTSQTKTVEIYPHRIPGSTTTARHYQIKGRTLVSTNDDDGEVFPGLRRRDRFQKFALRIERGSSGSGSVDPWNGPDTSVLLYDAGNYTASPYNNSLSTRARGFLPDGEGTPRTGKTTDPRSLGAVPALWAGRYVA